jgi:hypothetical protein
MDTTSRAKIIETYKDLMREVLFRIEYINTIIEGKSGIPHVLASEIAYLQLRMICEIIAIGCLVAHGDLPATHTKKLQETWEPHKILAASQRLRSYFYPISLMSDSLKDGVAVFPIRESGYLTKAELVKLHGLAGQVLHKGSASDVFTLSQIKHVDFREIGAWNQKICDLLSIHTIPILEGEELYLCSLRSQPNGDVRMVLASSKPPR